MNIQGAKIIDWSKPADVEYANNPGGILIEIGAASDDFINFLAFLNVPQGVLSLYAGEQFELSSGKSTFPFAIDWRLHHGTGRCVFETQPAATSTLFTSDKTSPLKREGMLLQLGGLEADSYLLRARMRGEVSDTFKMQISFFPKVTPGLQSSFEGITVGSLAG